MQELKHVGRLLTTGRKVLVAFKTIPGDAYHCLVIPTETLSDTHHDALISLVETPAAQNCFEFAEVLSRSKFSDGSTMLPCLHSLGKLLKVPTDKIEMTPTFQAKINLAELNQIIAEQKGVSVDDLAVRDKNAVRDDPRVEVIEVAKVNDISPSAKTTSGSVNEEAGDVLADNASPDVAAKHYRSQADKLAKQAAEFRRKAEELVPTKKAK